MEKLKQNLQPIVTSKQVAIEKALIEALPYIREFEHKTFVVKYGGAAMTDETLKAAFAQNVTLLRKVGINVVLVHGGGKEITGLAEKLNIPTKFVQGRRVTDEHMINVVQMTLAGKLNQDIVRLISMHGGKAVGVSGLDADTIKAKPYETQAHESLGFVGEVTDVNTKYINLLCDAGVIPVIAPIGIDDKGNVYNINADDAASSIAIALKAEKLIYVSDVPGVYADNTILKTVQKKDAAELIEEGIITGGMIPKVLSAFRTLDSGVRKVHLIDGSFAHSLLLEIFTDDGVGTQFVLSDDRYYSLND
ncbi:MAG: acetylglutamate kinase [Chlorobiales bacterium]|jgi:acetylglutamate kinase|nr:acetylglutamate kinase [Chlorobiales bacterium]